MSKKIKVYAPATVANVICAYDILGFALETPGDVVNLELNDSQEVRISEIDGDSGQLPLDAKKNTASVAVISFLEHLGLKQGVNLKLEKNLPLGSGLGSSAASSAAAVFAINELLDRPLKTEELIPFAAEAERVASGSAHADNVAPALLGEFALIRNNQPLDVIKIPSPKDLYCSIIKPDIQIKTEDARAILKKQVSLEIAKKQWANIAGLIAGLYRSDYQLISRSLEDHIFEPNRSLLIPGFSVIKAAALEAGAIACGISGSGPSIFALSLSEQDAKKVQSKMEEVCPSESLGFYSFSSKISAKGAHTID